MSTTFIIPAPLAQIAGDLRADHLALPAHIHAVCDRIDALDARLLALLPEAGRRVRLLAEADALAARYPERWRAVAPMSGPFIDAETYPFELIRDLPILMTEGTGAAPSLDGSRALNEFMSQGDFDFAYLEVDGDHGSMVPMVWPAIFEFFDAVSARP
mgnify:CR=1 FL=1